MGSNDNIVEQRTPKKLEQNRKEKRPNEFDSWYIEN